MQSDNNEILSNIGAELFNPNGGRTVSHIQSESRTESQELIQEEMDEVPQIEERFSEEYRKQNRISRPVSKSFGGRITSGTTATTERKSKDLADSFASNPLERVEGTHNSKEFTKSLTIQDIDK